MFKVNKKKHQSNATLRKYEKPTLLDAVKIHFQRFFALSFLHLISNGVSGVNVTSLTQIVALLKIFE